MEKNDSNIRKIIRKAIFESQTLGESDLLAKAGVNWEVVKPKFLATVQAIVDNIDTDDYEKAEKLIISARAMLKMWRDKIHKGQGIVNKEPLQFTLDEIQALFESED